MTIEDVDVAGSSAGDTVPKEHYENLKEALRQERAEKQEARLLLQQQQRTNELLEQMVAGNSVQEPEFDESGYPETYADIRKVTQREINKAVEQQVRPVVNAIQQQTYETQLSVARKEYTDFDEVIKLASEYIEENPEAKELLRVSKNIPATMYRIGQLHPKSQEKIIERTRQDTLRSISEPQGTFAGKPGTTGKPDPEAEAISKMSREQFLAKYGSRHLR